MTTSARRFEVLDGLRGVAALAVVWVHIRQILGYATWPPNAVLAVDFFFCLSGFVVAHAYEERLRSTLGFWPFAGRRLLRLMPLASLGALLGGGVLLLHALKAHDGAVIGVVLTTALNAAMLPSFAVIRGNPLVFQTDGPLWSLFWELLVNAGFALVALRLTTPRLVTLVALGAGLTLWTALTHDDLDVGSRNITFAFGFCRVLFPFSCGVLLHRLPVRANRLGPLLALVLAGVLLGPGLGAMGQALVVLAGFPLIVWLGAGARVGPRVSSTCLGFGRLSYPLYAIHHPSLMLLATVMRRTGPADPMLAAGAFLAFAVAAGWLATKADETGRAWLAVRLAAPAPGPAPATGAAADRAPASP